MLYIASDYAGFEVKERIKRYLEHNKISFIDFGCTSSHTTNDFTDFLKPVALHVRSSKKNLGILVCGTGQGMAIGANRFRKIRATLVHTPRQARYARTHDNANILVIAAWEVQATNLNTIVRTWLRTSFISNLRRIRRLKKIDTWPQ